MITIAQVEALLGYDLETSDLPRVQSYIDLVTSFLERETGIHLGVREGTVLVVRADGKGIVEIPDIVEIGSVESLDPSPVPSVLTSGTDYIFDGLDSIYNLEPYGVYRITLDHGWEVIPSDLKNIALMLVLAGTGLDTSSVEGLVAERVGDVEESYGVRPDKSVTLSTLMTSTLQSYVQSPTTFRT